jgi:hypothetical protein
MRAVRVVIAARRALAMIIAVMIIADVSVSVSAHRRDEYLQAARLAIEPTRVRLQLDLTPGIAIADTIVAAIDRDGDGVLSAAEKRAYVDRVLRDVTLSVDDHPLDVQPQLMAATFSTLEAFRTGEGTIRLQFDAAVPRQAEFEADGTHRVEFRNAHFPAIGAYLANALVPDSDRIAIVTQRRDVDQRQLIVEYALRGDMPTSTRVWLLGSFAGAAVLAAFLLRRAERRLTRGQRLPTAA